MKYFKLKNTEKLREYIGFLRKEYNSYHFGTQGAPLKKASYMLSHIEYIPKSAKKTIQLNITFNEMLKKKNKEPINPIQTKKSGDFFLNMLNGVKAIVKDNVVFVSTNILTYRFEIDGELKDGIYYKTMIGMKNNIPYIIVDPKSRLTNKKYLSNYYYNKSKQTALKRELKKLKVGLLNKQKGELNKQIKQKSIRAFKMNIVEFFNNLNKKFDNIHNKTCIPELHKSYVELYNHDPIENQDKINDIIRKIYVEVYFELDEVTTSLSTKVLLGKILTNK